MKNGVIGALSALSLVGVCASPTAAQQPVAADPSVKDGADEGGNRDPDTDARDIVVTGSLIRGLPREYVASPVFTYDQADIVRSGSGAVSEYMLTIPQNFTGDLSEFATTGAGIGSPLGDGTSYNQFDGFAGFALRASPRMRR